jgi:predicted small lipoprotein YifL
MILRILIVAALAFSVSGCGTKSELLLPDGKPSPRDQKDPSQPPSPISR